MSDDLRLDAARRYVEREWRVFVLAVDAGGHKVPTRNCDRCDFTRSPRHDMEACECLLCHGFYAATTDLDRVAEMLVKLPEGALALRTGEVSGVIVLDAEGTSKRPDEPTGTEVVEQWDVWFGWGLPATRVARTPSGGVHLYLRWPDEYVKSGRVTTNVDVKGDGGYVAVPDGRPGRGWLDETVAIASCPPEMVEWLRATTRRGTGGGRGGGGGDGHSAPAGYDYERFRREGAPRGYRDEFFNDLAFRLRKNGATLEVALAEMERAWQAAEKDSDAECRWEDAEEKVRRVWATVDPDDQPPPDRDPVVAVTEEPPPPEHRTDTGNARRFVRLLGHDVRYVAETRRWLLWDGTRWVPDALNAVLDLTTRVVQDVRNHAAGVPDADEQRRWNRWADASESERARRATVSLAASDPRVAVGVDDLDRNPLLLVVRNGTLDLAAAVLRESRREDLCTRCAAVSFEPDRPAPRWKQHVRFFTVGDEQLARYLRAAAGYCLTGLVTERIFFLLEGDGTNGKNAFIEPLVAVMGDYASTGTSALLTGGDEQHPTVLADLAGQRLVFVDEARQGRPLNVERIKQLTGSKRIKAREMRQDFFEFDAQLKLWIAGNNHPAMRDPTDGIWTRLRRVLCKAKVPDDLVVGDYGGQMYAEEAPGILNWCLAGLLDWRQEGGLVTPESVLGAVRDLRDEEDLVGQFLDECCQVTGQPGDVLTLDQLYLAYSGWCGLVGVRPREVLNRTQFGRELSAKKLGRDQRRVDGRVRRVVHGVRMGSPGDLRLVGGQ